jgi:hypothetical protein
MMKGGWWWKGILPFMSSYISALEHMDKDWYAFAAILSVAWAEFADTAAFYTPQ